ncbi:anion transporter [Mariprofundus erugo]|nr:anion transporter [Mariprofundus erugo]
MDYLTLAIFALSYVGLALGRVPGLALDRTGIALIGAVLMVVSGALAADRAFAAVDMSTMLLLYALMIFSAQFRLGGFYTQVVLKMAPLLANPVHFLGGVMAGSALMSALLVNDVVCLALTPVIIHCCRRASVVPVPHLLGLALASNIGSATTLIGNPQNMLLGQVGRLDFAAFTLWSLPPALMALVASFLLLVKLYRCELLPAGVPVRGAVQAGDTAELPGFDRWQSGKGGLLLLLLVALFFTDVPREWSALGLAALLLASRRMHTRSMLGLVDWHLLTLFAALFVLNAGFAAAGWLPALGRWMMAAGIHLDQHGTLIVAASLLSNLISNVPACMLLFPLLPDTAQSWYLLAATTTYAGNFFLIGSIANLIVVTQARQMGVVIGFGEHARVGIPATVVALLGLFGWSLIGH